MNKYVRLETKHVKVVEKVDFTSNYFWKRNQAQANNLCLKQEVNL